MITLSEAVAQVLRGEVAERNWHVDDLSEKAGRKKTTGWRHVKGKARMSIDDVEAYAGALGWTLEELLGRANEKRRPKEYDEPAPTLSEHVIRQLSPEAQAGVREGQRIIAERQGLAERTQSGN